MAQLFVAQGPAGPGRHLQDLRQQRRYGGCIGRQAQARERAGEPGPTQVPVDPKTEEQLRALGYVE